MTYIETTKKKEKKKENSSNTLYQDAFCRDTDTNFFIFFTNRENADEQRPVVTYIRSQRLCYL